MKIDLVNKSKKEMIYHLIQILGVYIITIENLEII